MGHVRRIMIIFLQVLDDAIDALVFIFWWDQHFPERTRRNTILSISAVIRFVMIGLKICEIIKIYEK